MCTAAIDVESGECLRPMPYLKNEDCVKLGIHPGAILVGDLEFQPHSSIPHIEDANWSNLEFHGACSGTKFKDILNNSLSDSIKIGFGVDFQIGQKSIPKETPSEVSIITIKLNPRQLRIHEDQYKPGKIKATITDSDGHRYSYLPITDRGFYDYAKKHQDDGRLDEVTSLIENQDEVFLRVGLSRAWSPNGDSDCYWLQVNGIYTFPDFHDEIRTYE